MKRIILIIVLISLLSISVQAAPIAIYLNCPEGTPAGEDNRPPNDGNDDRSLAGGVANWTDNGVNFAVWISKVGTYQVSDTFFPGDSLWGHSYFSNGMYFTTTDCFTNVGRTERIEFRDGDTLHIRFSYRTETGNYLWGLDTTGWISLLGLSAELVPESLYTGPDFEIWGIMEEERSIPNEFALLQNSPNPFNATTEISFTVPKDGNIKLEILDINGKSICMVYKGFIDAGSHDFIWNGKASSGNEVTTGTYLYRLEYDNQVIMNKMILIK